MKNLSTGFLLIIIICLVWIISLPKVIDNHYIVDKDKVSSTYQWTLGNKTVVPKKANVKLGLDYFCVIEFVDSTLIVEMLHEYNKFSYEIIRYYAWLMIEETNTRRIDTINYKGMKVYNIEKYTTEKYLKKINYLYTK